MASALCRLVGEVEHARAEGLRVDELQRLLLIAPVLKETLSAPHDATLRYSGGLSKPPPRPIHQPPNHLLHHSLCPPPDRLPEKEAVSIVEPLTITLNLVIRHGVRVLDLASDELGCSLVISI